MGRRSDPRHCCDAVTTISTFIFNASFLPKVPSNCFSVSWRNENKIIWSYFLFLRQFSIQTFETFFDKKFFFFRWSHLGQHVTWSWSDVEKRFLKKKRERIRSGLAWKGSRPELRNENRIRKIKLQLSGRIFPSPKSSVFLVFSASCHWWTMATGFIENR